MGKRSTQVGTEENPKKNQQKSKVKNMLNIHAGPGANICINLACRLRKAGCRGFEGCPGYMAK